MREKHKKKAVLVITDGIGYSEQTTYNAFYHAKKPTYDYLLENVPFAMISTFGLSVGLPEGQMGNSEVGHMCMGSGRVLYQDLVKISLALQNNAILQNPVFSAFLEQNQTIHLCALASDGGVHSHLDHLLRLAEICAQNDKSVWLHIITDGRDVLPQSALQYLTQIQSLCRKHKNIKIASMSGRFYAMDRDKRWERIESAHKVIVCAQNKTSLTPQEYIQSQYEKEIFDEFIEPASFGEFEGVYDGDGFVFVNFRSDRAREIVESIGSVGFKEFERIKEPRVHMLCMCEYDASFSFPILFPKDKVKNTLAEVISQANMRQLHTAETEKYAHVTFFLNGGREEEFAGEKRVLIPSPKVMTYDRQPEMSAREVGDVVLQAMSDGYEFIVVNFANGDMVGHTGNFDAAIKAVEAVDTQLGRILERARELDYSIVITSDHGNCEEMKDKSGNTLTNHTVGDVWCFVIGDGIKQINRRGGLNNIAPTILKILDLEIPAEMDKPLF